MSYGDLQTNVRAMLARSDLDTFIQTAIQRAIKAYEREPFYFNERSQTLTCSTGAAVYTLSASFVSMLSPPIVTVNTTRYPLDELSKSEIDGMDVSTTYTSDQPSGYNLYGGVFRPYPAPSATFTVLLNYTTRLSTLSTSADSNAWDSQAGDLIEQRALWWIHSFRTRNQLLAQASKAAEIEALRFLRNESTSKKSTGRIQGTQF
jgi:hypothetical protein